MHVYRINFHNCYHNHLWLFDPDDGVKFFDIAYWFILTALINFFYILVIGFDKFFLLVFLNLTLGVKIYSFDYLFDFRS